MLSYEDQYFANLIKIMSKGTVCVSGRQSNDEKVVRTKRVWGANFEIDLEEEFPILRSKHVFAKSAIQEILWIMKKQSNDINNLRPHIWDKWADETGSIGKAYGYQVRKPVTINNKEYRSQVHYVLESLAKDPSTRKAVIDLWSPTELGEMGLTPCCYTSHFAILDGRLNCMLTQRSGDYLVGVPFNTTQYAFLTIAFARHLGVKPGILLHNISDAHIYESQFGNFDTNERTESFATLMANRQTIETGNSGLDQSPISIEFLNQSTDFFDIGDDDFKILNYKKNVNSFDVLPFEVEA